jgi:L-threonine kinase
MLPPATTIQRAHPSTSSALTGVAALPATCGELFQGLLDGQPCLVSCPIDWCSRARVTLRPGGKGWLSPQPIPKTLAALALAALHLGLPGSGSVVIESTLPAGRGYGASTADIGAALYALARAAGRSLRAAEAARLAVQVEPTDSTLLRGLALFSHRDGGWRRGLGRAPRLAVLVLDPGGQVDTLAYNRQVTPQSLRRFAAAHRDAFEMIAGGLAEGDWPRLGQGATLSALTHQAVLFNPWLEAAQAAGRAVGGLGLCRAHSGTVLGILLDPARVAPLEAQEQVRAMLPAEVAVRLHWLVDGGPR